jgi:broad specificity phosphatase PhoE
LGQRQCRHGVRQCGISGRLGGHTDVAEAAEGYKQAAENQQDLFAVRVLWGAGGCCSLMSHRESGMVGKLVVEP